MGIIGRLFGKRDSEPRKEEEESRDIAFVLLSEACLPDAAAIVHAFHDFASPGQELLANADDSPKNEGERVMLLEASTGETLFVTMMPFAVPDGEAEHYSRFSLSAYRNGWKLPPHNAHLLVVSSSKADSKPIVRLSRFTSFLAAVTKASPAVGVYWGNAGATHDSDFLLSVAGEQDVVSRMMLWSGVSMAREKDGRLSLLSLGMEQLKLPDLLLVAGESSKSSALPTMYDLLAYVADRGEPLPEGDTVGRTEGERLPVHYVKSPIDSTKKVWRVELP
jgi:hypothetical protein